MFMINFSDLYESYGDDVYRFALWLAGNRSEAEDITSETFIRAWAHKSKIRTETLKAYLFTISRNIYLQHHRKRKKQAAFEDIHPDPAPGPERQVESQQELQKIQRTLQSMPEIDRTSFVLRVQHELPYAEVARVLKLSVTATKVKVYRVRKKLIAACLGKEGYPS
jgi:RNA polymerase sigma-70 factor (ECF subfamily)